MSSEGKLLNSRATGMCRKVEPVVLHSLQFIHSAFSRAQLSWEDKLSQGSRLILDYWGEGDVAYLRLPNKKRPGLRHLLLSPQNKHR